MEGEAGDRSYHGRGPVVIARALDAITRFFTLVRPGTVLTVLAAAAAVGGVLYLPVIPRTSFSIGVTSIPLALSPMHRQLLQALLYLGLYLLVLLWWLPGGRHAAQWTLLALAGSVVPFLIADDLLAACALLLAAAALAPLLVQGDDDGAALLFLGMSALGTACVVLGLLIARAAGPAQWADSLGPARVLVLAGLALLLGVAVLVPALALVTSGFRCTLRPALVLLLACGAWMSLGGPFSLAFSLQAEILQIIVNEGGAMAVALVAGVVLLVLAWLALVVRAWRLPLTESPRPCPRLALLVAAVVVVSANI